MRVATIDIGTNTVLLLVAERRGDGRLTALLERATVTRLGEGVDKARQLAPAAIARTLTCLDEYASVVEGYGVDRVAIVGTSAMRDARGGERIVEGVRAAFGVDPTVITGDAEARLTFSGGASGLDAAGDELAVFDIGGGSTEIILGRRGPPPAIAYAHSFDIGSVRLTERHVTSDPPGSGEIAAIEKAASAALARVPQWSGSSAPIGVAGTVTTLAAVALGIAPYDGSRIHGARVGFDQLRAVVTRLAGMTLAERRQVPGMEPKRADVVVAGGLVVLAILEHWSASSLLVSDRGVRWGLAEQLVAGG
ncbi:MAG: Ppx/GppA family phosphatase [Polyangiaceae bacterium]|nr:Ppx/GppA family phosphatase [Polyangiaceae bacterium]